MLKQNSGLFFNILRSPIVLVAPILICILKPRMITYELLRNIYYTRFVYKIECNLPKTSELDDFSSFEDDVKVVWVYWDSGFENAPSIVKLCLRKLLALKNVQVQQLSDANVSNFVQFPEAISKKYAAGKISKAHYSDLLRLELLYKYGGIWIDSTVLVTSQKFPLELMSDELFFFGMRKPSVNGNPIYLSSWLISASKKHPAFGVARKYLHNYWKKNSALNDYFLFHSVLCAVFNKYPHLLPKKFGFHDNSRPHILQLRFKDKFCLEEFEEIISLTPVHKLTNKYDEIIEGSYLDFVLNDHESLA